MMHFSLDDLCHFDRQPGESQLSCFHNTRGYHNAETTGSCAQIFRQLQEP